MSVFLPLMAQVPGPSQPPSGRLLESAPDYSQWVITFSYATPTADGAPAPPPSPADKYKLKSITTTKTGSIIHEELENGIGKTGDFWFVSGIEYFHSPGATTWQEVRPGSTGGMNYDSMPASGFRGLDWINGSNYIGMLSRAKHQYLVFTQGSTPGGPKTPTAEDYQNLTTYALIDNATRFPVEVKALGTVSTYHFADPPTEKQQLPPDLVAVIKGGEELRARLSQQPPRPY
jgi:hypothetical protein